MEGIQVRPRPEEPRVVSYARWESVWAQVQECEALYRHWQERVRWLRGTLRTRALAGAERVKYQAVLREAYRGLLQARSALAAQKTRLLRECAISGLDTRH